MDGPPRDGCAGAPCDVFPLSGPIIVCIRDPTSPTRKMRRIAWRACDEPIRSMAMRKEDKGRWNGGGRTPKNSRARTRRRVGMRTASASAKGRAVERARCAGRFCAIRVFGPELRFFVVLGAPPSHASNHGVCQCIHRVVKQLPVDVKCARIVSPQRLPGSIPVYPSECERSPPGS